MADVNYTPHDWAAGEFVTEVLLDTEIRDPWTNIQSAWSTYTPLWGSSPTAPVLGNGTIAGRYRRIGKTILFSITLTMGSTTTFGGANQWLLGLPITPLLDKMRFANVQFYDSSVPAYWPGAALWTFGGNAIGLYTPNTTAGTSERVVNSTTPFTWATSDIITVNGSYESG